MQLRLLHLSDIHFRHPDCTTGHDPEKPYRTKLADDAVELANQHGAVDAILVSGDIAYRALPPEYAAARSWLFDLASRCGCESRQILVVPGNHDVDWGAIKNNLACQNAQRAIFTSQPEHKGRTLVQQIRDDVVGRALFAPLENYNKFAAEFGCQIHGHRPYWTHDLKIDDVTKLRLHGLTSTLLSGIGVPIDREDKKGDLYLSEYQTVLDPENGIVNLAMAHHPPDWCSDADEIEDALRGRASIHVFGHKHRNRILREVNYLRLSAGAVNPVRTEQGWEPGYNYIQLQKTHDQGRPYLNVVVRSRRWQVGPPDMFVPKFDHGGVDSFAHRLPVSENLRGKSPPDPVALASNPDSTKALSESNVAQFAAARLEGGQAGLVRKFWNLPPKMRRDIALRLKLIALDDLRLAEPERYSYAIARAIEGGSIARLAEEVERMEDRNGRN